MSDPQDPSSPQRPPYNGAPPGQPHATPYPGDPRAPGGPPGWDGPPMYGHQPGQPHRRTLSRGGVLFLGIGGGLAVLLAFYWSTTAGPLSGGGSEPQPVAPSPAEQSPYDFEIEPPENEIPDVNELPGALSQQQADEIDVTATHGGLAGDTVDPNAVYTVVDLEVENGSSEPYGVEVMSVEIILADGSSLSAVYETEDADIDRISSEDIPPGESITGQIAVVGEVQPVQVEIDPLLGDGTILVDVE